MNTIILRIAVFSASAVAFWGFVNTPTLASSHAPNVFPPGVSLEMPETDSKRGRQLFASKGCVACHSVNGVGGHDAAALDAHTMQPKMNPFDFAAQMWAMAPFMIAAQEEALGEQITFTGQELADIVAFIHDDGEQHNFSEDDIPPRVKKMMGHGHAAPAGGTEEHAEEIGHSE